MSLSPGDFHSTDKKRLRRLYFVIVWVLSYFLRIVQAELFSLFQFEIIFFDFIIYLTLVFLIIFAIIVTADTLTINDEF